MLTPSEGTATEMATKKRHYVEKTLVGALCGVMVAAGLPEVATAAEAPPGGGASTAATSAVAQVVATLHAEGQTCPHPGRLLSEKTVTVPEANDLNGSAVTATVYKIAAPLGTTTEVIPPKSWRPADATQAELKYFGVPQRPSSPSALKRWQYYWIQHFSTITLTVPCGLLKTESDSLAKFSGTSKADNAGSPHALANRIPSEPASANWSGSVTTNTTNKITEAVGTTTWYDASTCSAHSGWAHWVGIGGYGVPELLQNGFIQGQTGGSHLFWEAIGNGVGLPAETLSPTLVANDDIHHGDTVRLATSFHDGTAQFIWHDLDTGGAAILQKSYISIVINGQLHSFPASEFYNGDSGEVIDERPEVSGQYVRLQDFGNDVWSQVDFADHQYVRHPMGHWNDHKLDMETAGIDYANAVSFSNSGFADHQEHCGSRTPA